MSQTKRRRTLVVEDDPAMRAFYARFFERLRGDGFTFVIVENAEEALDILQHEPVDLMLLDWTLPGISGEALLRVVRANPKTRPLGVLMVTARSEPSEEVLALDSGADDHLTKPFEARVLRARLLSLCRRKELSVGESPVIRHPGLDLDLKSGSVRVQGRRVRLTPKELGLLEIFLHWPNIHHPQAYLWETVWGYQSEKWERLLDITLSSLRRKLGKEWGPRLICHEGKSHALRSPL